MIKFKAALLIQFLFINIIYWTPFLKASESDAIYQFGIVGDAGWSPEETKPLRQSLQTHKVSHLILPGDNLYHPKLDYRDVWDIWKKEKFIFDLVAIGNHHKGYENEMRYFKMKKEYFRKEYGSNSFYVLNSDNEESVAKQFQWLEDCLRQDSNPNIFLIYHHPTFTVSPNHGWEEKKDFQEKMQSLLKRYAHRITSLIVGHDHISSLIHINETPMIVSGSGVEVRDSKPVNYLFDDHFHVKTMWLAPKLRHWVKLTINEHQSKIIYDFIDVHSKKTRWSHTRKLN